MNDLEFLLYLTNNRVLELVGVFSYGLRFLGWKLIEVLVSLVNGLENAISQIYKLNTFFKSTHISNFLDNYKGLLWVIFAIAIAFLGFQIIAQRKKDKGQIPVNIAISLAVIILLPTIMSTLNNATNLIVGENVGKYTSTGNEIVKNNLSDLYYLDKVGYKLDDKRNDIPKSDVMNIDINEKLDIGNIKDKQGSRCLVKKLISNANGTLKATELGDSFFSFLDENYYRYNLNFMVVIISLLVTATTLICCSLKIGRIIIELGFNRILATVLAFGDVGGGKRLKSVVENILSMFAILITTSVLLKIYTLFTGWLATTSGANDSVVRLLVLTGASWAVIDGPNIIERIFGIDAGLKSSWGLVLAGIQGAKTAGRGASSLLRFGGKTSSRLKDSFSNMKKEKEPSSLYNDMMDSYKDNKSSGEDNKDKKSNFNNTTNNGTNKSGVENNINNKNGVDNNINNKKGNNFKDGDKINSNGTDLNNGDKNHRDMDRKGEFIKNSTRNITKDNNLNNFKTDGNKKGEINKSSRDRDRGNSSLDNGKNTLDGNRADTNNNTKYPNAEKLNEFNGEKLNNSKEKTSSSTGFKNNLNNKNSVKDKLEKRSYKINNNNSFNNIKVKDKNKGDKK
ncbi:hypothetical protein K5V21_12655 [Clostridium sardiniense]|uniref:DUF8208 domain-containing protein n=1 Tax=Clostridium sardiniense TaxID=29369 RepID=A0ABS7KZQ3_CLOSR|nr:hypothetical protein [Clostridium sardiniense]MBY0756298.1 hypothetical protein [Clostridium sardiniense]MDQ0461452.1 hypothetical protein [Clostridium sardiniense]